MKKYLIMLTILSLIFTACGAGEEVITTQSANVVSEANLKQEESVSEEVIKESSVSSDSQAMPPAKLYNLSANMVSKLSRYDQLTYYNEETATIITGADNIINVTGEGVIVTDNKVLILEEGTYIVRGEFVNTGFEVNSSDVSKVHLVLDGANISNTATSPIYATHGDKLIITLAKGTVNELSDAVTHANDTMNGCLYSRIDLTINGEGSLNINGKYANGISSRGDIKIYGSKISIEAANDGIKGNNSVSIFDSKVTITSRDDGIKTNEEEDKSKGFIFINASVVEITTEDDILQATNGIFIREDADVRGRCYGSLANCKSGIMEGTESIKTWE